MSRITETASGTLSTAQYGSLQWTETLEQREGKEGEKGERNNSAEARPSYLKYDYLIQASSAERGGSPACLHAWSALHACSLVTKETDSAPFHTSLLIEEKLELSLVLDTAVGSVGGCCQGTWASWRCCWQALPAAALPVLAL